MTATYVIDCERCPKRTDERECEDCIVAYLVDKPAGAVVFDVAEERAIRALADGGLIPEVKLRRSG
ncbi:MAG TPA: hypothetical protein VGB83_09170 [Actinomycetota bacterium]